MKLGSSEMFGRGKHEAREEEARAEEARANEGTGDETTASAVDYAEEPTTIRPTFTPADAGAASDGDLVQGEVVGGKPVTAAGGEPVTGERARRRRMAFERPADASQPAAYDEAEAFDRPASVDEPAEYDRSVSDYNEPAGRPVPPVPPVPDAPAGTGTVASGDLSAVGSYPALDPDEPTRPTGVAEPAGTVAGVPSPRTEPVTTGQPGAALSAGPMSDLDQPLFSDTELQSRWQRVQAGFVEDPRVAVSEAADLVEQAGQSLADALRERQTRLRALWDNGAANGTGRADEAGMAAAGGMSDTEELRLMMRRYRGLFDQLSHL